MKENKELQNQEEESQFPSKSQNDLNTIEKIQLFFDKNSKAIIGVSIAIIVIVIGIFYLNTYVQESSQTEKEEASVALARITKYYQASDYPHALYGDSVSSIRGEEIIGLLEISKKYEGTAAGNIAALYAANCFMELGNTDEAEKYFSQAKESTSKEVLMGANAGLAACKETKENYKEASELYLKAAEYSIAPGIKNRYQFFAALCFEKLNEAEKAAKIYNDIIAENQSEFVAESKYGLVRLGMKIE